MDVEFPDFLKVIAGCDETNTATDQASVLKAFELFDESGSGVVSKADLFHILTATGDICSQHEISGIMSGVGDSVDYAKFVNDIFTTKLAKQMSVADSTQAVFVMQASDFGGGMSVRPSAIESTDDFGGGFDDDDDGDDDDFGF